MLRVLAGLILVFEFDIINTGSKELVVDLILMDILGSMLFWKWIGKQPT